MRQKYSKLSFVHITEDMPPYMSHFKSDFDAIIKGTYSQLYGGKDVDSYSVYVLEEGKVVNALAWYEEDQLTLLPNQDSTLAEQLIEDYNFQDTEE